MSISFILFFFTAIFFQTKAQTDSIGAAQTKTSEVYMFCSEMPTLKNKKYKTFNDYARANMVYPADVQKAHVTGVVFVQFIVKTDGSLSDVDIVKGRGLHPSCDQAALDVVSKSQWNPGVQNGKPVDVRMIVKIFFDKK
jgi:protein TonB